MRHVVLAVVTVLTSEARKRAIGYVFKAAEMAAAWTALHIAHVHVQIHF